MKLKNYFTRVADTIRHETEDQRYMRHDVKSIGLVTLALTFITLVMCYLNYVQKQYAMLIATSILVLALFGIFLLSALTKNDKLVSIMFCLVLSALIAYFTLTGGNDGFAILWTLLFIPYTMLLIGYVYGITAGLAFLVFFAVLFWTPLNVIVEKYYTQTFMLRFPMLYTAFFILSFLAKYIIVTMEITEQKARSANEAKSEFLSRVSHELRTPLNVILSMARLGLNDKSLEESTNRFEKIMSSSSHLSNIINDVLEMSRMESGKTEIRREPMSLKQAVKECVELFIMQASDNNIILMSEIDESLPEALVGDVFRIKQIIINLLSNAIKFTEKGMVSLWVKVTERLEDNIMVNFTVNDTGIGMSEAFLEKVFSPFEQEDSFLSRRYEGSGLGLSISYNLVELMGGKMEVESKLGEGSRFSYTIPFGIAAAEEPAGETGADSGGASLKGRRILLVDDLDINRIIASELLAETGVELEEASDGEEAYHKYLESPEGYFDCVLMDIQMPKMDGYSATGAIRASGRADSGIPVIAMTANALKEDIDSAIAAGMNDHIAKPIDFDDCIQKTVKWCGIGAS